jgi:DNA-binding transcriptional regulator YbjK
MSPHAQPVGRQRKRDGQERRRALCNAAIQVLSERGSRGLTHQQVDRCAAVPDGTTSYYYRTREALLRGVGQRVADIDTENLRSVTDAETRSETPFGRLAQLVMLQSEGEGLHLNRARLELLLAATRDPTLAGTAREFLGRVVEMARQAIAELAPDSDAGLVDRQATALMTYIAGMFTRFAAGDRTVSGAGELESLMETIVAAVASQ